MRLRLAAIGLLFAAVLPVSLAHANEEDPSALIGELMAFHGSETIVTVMSTHCYETTGLDPAFRVAAENWQVRNIGFLDLADRVIERLGGAEEGQRQTAQTYAGTQIMSAYNQAEDQRRFCRDFLAKLEEGGFDIDVALPGPLAEAQQISSN